MAGSSRSRASTFPSGPPSVYSVYSGIHAKPVVAPSVPKLSPLSYWQHHRNLDSDLMMKTVGCMSNRQAARDLGVGHSAVDRHISHLARHRFLFHTLQMQHALPITEVVVCNASDYSSQNPA